MPSFSEFSTTPGSNSTAGGVSIAEGCAAANLNDAVRYSFACGRSLYDTVISINLSNYMPVSGGAFTSQITRSGSGGYFYNANAAQGGGKVSFLPVGSALPSSPAEGDVVFFY